ncbi:MAG TPA: response regulator [Caulobacterales bacterium]|nr:response regulator [Caulobacterales bacterium]
MDLLIVEDDEFNREMLTRRFVRAGFSAAAAADGREGLRIAAETRPRVIVLDAILPDMAGEDVIAAIRARADIAATPVVVLTSDSGREPACREAGCDAFKVKPVEFSDLLKIVRMFNANPG